MKPSFAKFGIILGALVALAGPAAAQLPSPQDIEVLVVESLNTQIFKFPQLHVGAQTVFLVAPVKRPETICGNAGGSATTLVNCFEFALVYVTYDTNGQQILHLPQCNNVPFDDPACELPANNKCAGNLALDPFQIKAPVCGDTEVDIIPLNDTVLNPLAAAFGKWDGVSIAPPGKVFISPIMRGGTFDSSARTYRAEVIRVPASVVNPTIPGITVALVAARHEPLTGLGNVDQIGFFSPLKRNMVWNQELGNLHDVIVFPIIFQLQ